MTENQIIKAVKQQTIIAGSFLEVNVSDLQCPIVAVYVNPKDYPGYCVARIFDMDKPTNVILVKDTLDEIRLDIRLAFPKMESFRRAWNDVLCIAESWM